MIRHLVGDCRVTLPTLEPGSVQACVTSPPYYSLRDYGTPPLVWGGDEGHAHEWAAEVRPGQSGGTGKSGLQRDGRRDDVRGPNQARWVAANTVPSVTTSFCQCGAWLGSLGLEPTPGAYIDHLVECFRHVRRVLNDTGVLWLNLGDSHAGSGKGPSHSVQGPASQLGRSAPSKQTTNAGSLISSMVKVPGYKNKDLMMMPFRVAMALQADGWWLRSVIPWLKRCAMPESVTDRPSTSVEYVFLLSKSARYFWNADAVRVDGTRQSTSAANFARRTKERPIPGQRLAQHRIDREPTVDGGTRNRRNGDWFVESWQGLMLDEQDDPLALVVNPRPFSGAHFATFPPRLVEPMVKASTRPGDTILDPFSGAGTVGLVANRLGRDAVLAELKPEYAEMSAGRIDGDAPMFTELSA